MGGCVRIHHIGFTANQGKLDYVRSLTWPEVKEMWRGNEEYLEHWQKYWKAQGYKSWEEWRKKFFWRFNTARADWALYRISSPQESIPLFKPGSFRGWRKFYYPNFTYTTFAELTLNSNIINHPPIREFQDHLKKMGHTTIIGLVDPDSTTITVIEGMHRCAAYCTSMLTELSENRPKTEFYIALGIGKERWLSRLLCRFGVI